MMDLWAYRNGVKIDFSRPGKTTDNAFCESFNGTFRAECLDTNWFQTLPEAKHIIEQWRQEYNVSRPHRALADRTPAEFASQIALKRDLTETKNRPRTNPLTGMENPGPSEEQVARRGAVGNLRAFCQPCCTINLKRAHEEPVQFLHRQKQ